LIFWNMVTLNSLDILYITLSIFVATIWTLLAIVLFRIIKILWPIMEMVWYYNNIKDYLAMYTKIPWIIKDRIFEFIEKFFSNKEK